MVSAPILKAFGVCEDFRSALTLNADEAPRLAVAADVLNFGVIDHMRVVVDVAQEPHVIPVVPVFDAQHIIPDLMDRHDLNPSIDGRHDGRILTQWSKNTRSCQLAKCDYDVRPRSVGQIADGRRDGTTASCGKHLASGQHFAGNVGRQLVMIDPKDQFKAGAVASFEGVAGHGSTHHLRFVGRSRDVRHEKVRRLIAVTHAIHALDVDVQRPVIVHLIDHIQEGRIARRTNRVTGVERTRARQLVNRPFQRGDFSNGAPVARIAQQTLQRRKIGVTGRIARPAHVGKAVGDHGTCGRIARQQLSGGGHAVTVLATRQCAEFFKGTFNVGHRRHGGISIDVAGGHTLDRCGGQP